MSENGNEEMNETQQPTMPHGYIGTCVSCGIAVTMENLGQKFPKVMCKSCVEQMEAEKRRTDEERARREAEAVTGLEQKKTGNRKSTIIRMVLSNVVALALAIVFAILVLRGETPNVPVTLGIAAFIFTYVASLFYPGSWTREVFLAISFNGFHLPFIIFEFDLDGCLMFIAFKALSWVLGILLGALGFILSILIGVIISPFVYIFLTVRDILALVKGEYHAE